MRKEADSLKSSAGMLRTISDDLKAEVERVRHKIREFGTKLDTARAISETEWKSAAAGPNGKVEIDLDMTMTGQMSVKSLK